MSVSHPGADGRGVSRSARLQCVQALTAVLCLAGGVQAVARPSREGRSSLVALLVATFGSLTRAGAGGMPPAPVLHACGTTSMSRRRRNPDARRRWQPPAGRRGRMDAGSLRLRGGGGWSGALVTRTLYGGAIKLDLPSSFDDVSAFRQVPDHQEVWVDRDSNRSVIVELLDMEEDCQDFEVCEHIFRDCAQANNASDISILSQRRLRAAEVPKLMLDPPCPKTWISLWLLSGYQNCAKFNYKERDHVHVHMFVARLPNVRTDLCIFFNEPMHKPPTTTPPAASDTEGGAWEAGAQVLADIARSLQV